MNRSVNMVILIGNVGNDPEIRSMSNGKKFATMQVATTRTWKDSISNEQKSETEWHYIVTYIESLVNLISNYIKKGSKVYIKGRIKTNTWEDKNGAKRYEKRILLDGYDSTLIMLDKKEFSSKLDMDENAIDSNNDNDFNSDDSDEIPF